MSYDLSVQSRDSHASAHRVDVDSFLASLPGTRLEKMGIFAYADNRRRVLVHIYTGDADNLDSVELSVAAAFTGSSGKEALLLAFRIAKHLGWQVFDPQTGEFLDESTPAQVLRSQTRFSSLDEDVSLSHWPGRATFGELFNNHFSDTSRRAMLPSLAIALLVSGYFLVTGHLSSLVFILLCACLALLLAAGRALLLAVWDKIRDLKP